MFERIRILLRARLASKGADAVFPVTTLLTHGLVASVLCGLVRGGLPAYAYALVALSLTGALIAIPLLGELGYLLRADAAAAWVSTLPVRPLELRLARTAHLLVGLGVLALATLLPAAVLAPSGFDLVARAGLVFSGLGLALLASAFLLCVQSVLGGRAESILLLVQTALVVGVVVGLVMGVPAIAGLVDLQGPGEHTLLSLLPPAWFALPFGAGAGSGAIVLPLSIAALSLAVLAALPPTGAPTTTTRPSAFERLLLPARRLATRSWVRTRERPAFDLVYDALPREREVVLRTVPMLGIPLAFLVAASVGDAADDMKQRGLLALLLFTPGVYLPILLTQVPVSASWRARWIFETGPVSTASISAGATKALAVRFLFPLYLVLFALAWWNGGAELALSLAMPGALVSMLVLQSLYPFCATEAPLSQAPDEVTSDFDLGGYLFGLALVLTVVAVLAAKYVTSIGVGVAVAAVLLAAVALGERGRE